jgi:hypothetical protein
VHQTAEQVASAHLTWFSLTDDGQSGGLVRCLKLERPVGTVPVVVLDVDPKDLLQMAAPNDQQPIQALGADGADPPFCAGVRGRRPHWRHHHLARGVPEVSPVGQRRCDRQGYGAPSRAAVPLEVRMVWSFVYLALRVSWS